MRGGANPAGAEGAERKIGEKCLKTTTFPGRRKSGPESTVEIWKTQKRKRIFHNNFGTARRRTGGGEKKSGYSFLKQGASPPQHRIIDSRKS